MLTARDSAYCLPVLCVEMAEEPYVRQQGCRYMMDKAWREVVTPADGCRLGHCESIRFMFAMDVALHRDVSRKRDF